jgi:hypothetical protein
MDVLGSFNPQQTVDIYIVFLLLSALVQSLPPLTENSNVVYATFYRFMSIVIADFKSFAAKKLPAQPETPKETV